MTDRVHQISSILRDPGEPVMTACGQRDGHYDRVEGVEHYTTFNGRVTCPDCQRAIEAPGQLAWEWAP